MSGLSVPKRRKRKRRLLRNPHRPQREGTDMHRKSNRCQMLEANSNPPLSPFFKGGIFSEGFRPLPSTDSGQAFGKEGKGRFFAKAGRNYGMNFWVTKQLAKEIRNPNIETCPELCRRIRNKLGSKQISNLENP